MRRLLDIYMDAFRGLPREVWLLSAVLFINRSGTVVLTFLTLYLTTELGHSLTFAGQVMGVYGLGHLAGSWIGGWLCDRLGALRIQLYSLVFSGLGCLVLERLRSAEGLLIMAFLLAVATEAFRPANGAALAAFSPPHLRTRAVALNRLALNLGFSAGPALGGWLATRDYSYLFWVDGVTCLLAALLLKVLFFGRHARRPIEEESGTDGIHPFADLPFLAVLALTFLTTLVFYQAWTTYPVFLYGEYGFSEAQFGLLMTFNALLILAFEMIITHRAEAFRVQTVIGIGAFLNGLGFAILPLGREALLAVASMAILTFGEMLFVPAAGGWVANRAGVRHRGKYMGLYTMSWGLAFTAAPPAGTWIYEHLGPSTLWVLSGALALVTWLGFEILGKRMAAAPPTARRTR